MDRLVAQLADLEEAKEDLDEDECVQHPRSRTVRHYCMAFSCRAGELDG